MVSQFETTLASPLLQGDTSGGEIFVASIQTAEGHTLSLSDFPFGVIYIVVEPKNSNFEIIKCTNLDGSGIGFTGPTRGLPTYYSGGETTITDNVKAHSAGVDVIITDNINWFLDHFMDLHTNQSAFGVKTFASFPLLPSSDPTTSLQAAHKKYVDEVASGGIGSATDTTAGSVKVDQNPNSFPRVKNVLVQQQSSPNLTLKVLPFDTWLAAAAFAYVGGNTTGFISPSLQISYVMTNKPSNGNTFTFTINGTAITITFVTSIGSNPGNVLIGADAAATQVNLLGLLQNPGTTNANQVALSGGNQTLVGYLGYTSVSTAIVCQGLNGTAITSVSGTTNVSGNTAATNTNPRIDLIVYDTLTSTLITIQGTTAASPTTPTITAKQIIIAEVRLIAGMTLINDVSDGTNGYIQKWFSVSTYPDPTPTGVLQMFAGSSAPGGYLICDGSAVSRATYASLFAIVSTSYGTGDGSTTFNLPDARSRMPVGKGTGTLVKTFASTDVNTSTDQIAIASTANLFTGMAMVLTNPGTAPSGLTVSTTYYVIVIDSTHIQLAGTLALAIAGTQIDITAQGSGTNTLTLTLSTRALGDVGGEETHGLTVAELAVHVHANVAENNPGGSSIPSGGGGTGGGAYGNSGPAGSSTAHNNMTPFFTINYIIKY